MRYHHYGINCDYAQRREFHRPFWEALRALGQRLLERMRRPFATPHHQPEVR